jgi:hypothetical protein
MSHQESNINQIPDSMTMPLGRSKNLQPAGNRMSGVGINIGRLARAMSSQTPNIGNPNGTLQTPAQASQIPRAIIPGEVYPFHLFHYPDLNDYNINLSNDFRDKCLDHLLNDLATHVSSPTAIQILPLFSTS